MQDTAKTQKAWVADAALTIRRANPVDELPLIRLAGRDSRPLPRGEVLVADLDGELLAARSLTDGLAIADPFRPTAAIADLLARRAEALAPASGREQRRVGRAESQRHRSVAEMARALVRPARVAD